MAEEITLDKMKTDELINALQDRGYFASKIPPTDSGRVFKPDLSRWNGKELRFAVISCTHLGSRYQQITYLHDFYKLAKREHCEFVIHAGDLVEGERVYRSQEYEIFLHGADEQVAYAVANYPKGLTTYMINGNHNLSFYSTAGINVGKAVAKERDDMIFIGDYYATLDVNGLKMAVMHGAQGASYARSYKLQKIVEQLSSENKPHFLFLGHYHISAYLPQYRNVESFMVGCFQAQTPFLARLGLQPVIGGWIFAVKQDESGLSSVKVNHIPFYKPIRDDF